MRPGFVSTGSNQAGRSPIPGPNPSPGRRDILSHGSSFAVRLTRRQRWPPRRACLPVLLAGASL
jgi:hypothetical protein